MAKPPAEPKTLPGYMNFVLGGTAGILGICCVQPADLLKTRMQLLGQEGRKASFGTVAGEILRKEGLRGFYNGISAAVFRQATYTTARLGSFNAVLDVFKKKYGTPNYGGKILVGMCAGGIGAFFGVPAEVCLIRMTADGRLPPEKRRNYKHVIDALIRIIREEGLLTLWRGGTATVTRAMVVNGAQLATYAQASEVLAAYMRDGVPKHFLASMTSGFVTAFASLPVDIVKTRVQNAEKGTSQIRVLTQIIKNEGVLALWSGFMPTWAKIGPHTVLTFIFLEQLKKLYFQYMM